MNRIIQQMLTPYNIKTTNDEINAMKEIIQEIVLSGLSRGGFFEKAAFYGGTALRIFYDLDRFSEDLDFALLTPDKNFDLSQYFEDIQKEVNSCGLNLEIQTKKKSKQSNITSAFLKGDTLEHILIFFPAEKERKYDHLLKGLKIKFEVDINPPDGALYEQKYKLLPSPHIIQLYDKGSLFAGKIHAVLCRNWQTRTKGRDLYDYVFFLATDTSVNLNLVRNKLIESNYITADEYFDIDILRAMLIRKFNELDYESAKQDVIPFINNPEVLALWSKDFFVEITHRLK